MEKWGMSCKDCCHDVMECTCLGFIEDRAPDLSDYSNRPPRALYTIQDLYRKLEEFRDNCPEMYREECGSSSNELEYESISCFLSWLSSGRYKIEQIRGEDR